MTKTKKRKLNREKELLRLERYAEQLIFKRWDELYARTKK